ncbi:PocR ligand-binding domain-containing protein [Faecalicatena contorta]|uniref:PocR ligand-binding domain-containing protein n=1 Tax=Faecalicatena contorta TaxID=39482 RepID=UPI00189864B6|nr:PocR ligand-binding domain-containing protein [Faecalicatena contorta]
MISSFDISKLHSLLKDFYNLTKIRITVFDDAFHELTSYPDEIAPFCQIIRSSSAGAAICHECDARACKIAAKKRTLYTYRCHAGLTESITPILMGNIVIGYLLFGHVFSYPSYEAGWNKIQKLCKSYELSMEDLKAACRRLPIIQADYITSASHIMQAVSSFLCIERMVSLRQQELPVQIDEYIQAHFTEDIDAVSIAQYFKIGKTKIYEIAKQNYGIGIAEYIRKLRIEKAKLLLSEQPDLTLAEIASECGFCDYNYFITVFKRVTGMPPKQYQKNRDLVASFSLGADGDAP